MKKTTDAYVNPLTERYASPEMSRIFSPRFKFETWRKLWLWLAEEERRLGLPISEEAIAQLRDGLSDIDFEAAGREEERTRHDVMAHVRVFGERAPAARGIIHWGATSAYVTDNADLIQMREALSLLEGRLASVLRRLRDFALAHRDLPALAYTHFQPAQPTTVGKRAVLWAADLLMDLEEIRRARRELRFLGAKGATGTQASFLALFDGDSARVEELDRALAARAGFERRQLVSGQTYSRKQDDRVVHALSGLGQSAHKLATDLRLLQHEGELEEPSESDQVGSSAMPYKRNPMRAERMSALSRFAIQTAGNLAYTAVGQWLERSLDDSAVKRIALPELFLAVDSLLVLYYEVAGGLEVHEAAVSENLRRELPAMATETLLMAAAGSGGDRQQLHERIRIRAREAAARIEGGDGGDLLDRLAGEPGFAELPEETWRRARDPATYVGRAPEQTRSFLSREVRPRLEAYGGPLEMTGEVRV